MHLPRSNSSSIGVIRCKRDFFSLRASSQLSSKVFSEERLLPDRRIRYFDRRRSVEHPRVWVWIECKTVRELLRYSAIEKIIDRKPEIELYGDYFRCNGCSWWLPGIREFGITFQGEMAKVHTNWRHTAEYIKTNRWMKGVDVLLLINSILW